MTRDKEDDELEGKLYTPPRTADLHELNVDISIRRINVEQDHSQQGVGQVERGVRN